MKLYQKMKLFGRNLRTGLLFVCLLSVAWVFTGCGSEDRLLSGLQKEDAASFGEDFDETASGYSEIAERDGDADEQSINGEEMQDYGQNAAEEGAGAEQNNGVLCAENQPGTEKIYVHVCGEVKTPGVYELSAGSRFYEAVEAAGGFTEDACRDYLNMAAPLADGSRLEIPSAEAIAGQKERERSGESADGTNLENEYNYYTYDESVAAADQTGGDKADASEGLVNINTADVTGLCTLPGVGEARAKAIIEYREKQGGFQKKEDIMQVSGIGEKMYARMEAYLTVG